MELDFELTPFPDTIKFYWDFFGETFNIQPKETGLKLGHFYFI